MRNAITMVFHAAIKNFVSPGSLDGYARSYSGSTLSTDSQYMPYGVATLPED